VVQSLQDDVRNGAIRFSRPDVEPPDAFGRHGEPCDDAGDRTIRSPRSN
jgi:hypothetical protein